MTINISSASAESAAAKAVDVGPSLTASPIRGRAPVLAPSAYRQSESSGPHSIISSSGRSPSQSAEGGAGLVAAPDSPVASPALLARIEAQIMPEPNSGCWLWLGLLNEKGYGRIQANGRNAKVHRLLFESVRGAIPSSLVDRRTANTAGPASTPSMACLPTLTREDRFAPVLPLFCGALA